MYKNSRLKKYQFLLFFLVGSISCKNITDRNASVQQNTNDIKFQRPEISIFNSGLYDTGISSVNIFKNIEIIKAKISSDQNSVVADARKILLINGNFYILDKKFSGLKVFSKKGDYLYQIGKTGKGPGEYVRINDVQMFNSRTVVLLCDNTKLEYFDILGNHIKSVRLNFFASSFAIADNYNFLFYINNNFIDRNKPANILLTDSSVNIVSDFFQSIAKEDALPSFDYTGFLIQGAYGPLFSLPFDDKVWQYEKSVFNPEFKFNLGPNKLPDEVLNNNTQSRQKERWQSDYLGNEIFDTQKFLFFSFKDGSFIKFGVFDKQKNKMNNISDEKDIDDYLANLLSVPLGGLKDTVIVGVQPEKIIYLKEKRKDYIRLVKEKNKELFNLINDYQPTDNLVLLKFII